MAAFNLAAAVAGANNDFLNAFQQSGPVAARGELSRLVVARNDSSVPTINMFIDGESPSMGYAASIIDACVDQTTYALRCTSGPSYIPETLCGADAIPLTVTAGPATYIISTATSGTVAGSEVFATVQENCELQGTTQAVCTATVGGSVDDTTTASSTTMTLSGSSYYRFDVAITGGAEKTANPTGECRAPSGANTKAVAMWGLVGVVGVASLLAF